MSDKTLSLLACIVFMTACSSPSRGSKADHRGKEAKVSQSEQKIDELAVKAFANRGYDSGIEYATENAKLSPSSRGRGGRNGKKSSGSESNSSPMPAKRPPVGPTQRAMMEVAIAQISTAFLNSHVKNDNFAKAWLRNDSQPWLYNIGQLKEK